MGFLDKYQIELPPPPSLLQPNTEVEMEQKDCERNASSWLGMTNLMSSPSTVHVCNPSHNHLTLIQIDFRPPHTEHRRRSAPPQWPKRAVQLRTWPASARELQMNVSGIGMDRVTIKRRSHIGGYFIPICSVVVCPLSLKQSHWITAEEEQKVDMALLQLGFRETTLWRVSRTRHGNCFNPWTTFTIPVSLLLSRDQLSGLTQRIAFGRSSLVARRGTIPGMDDTTMERVQILSRGRELYLFEWLKWFPRIESDPWSVPVVLVLCCCSFSGQTAKLESKVNPKLLQLCCLVVLRRNCEWSKEFFFLLLLHNNSSVDGIHF